MPGELNDGQWTSLCEMTDMLIRFCRIHKDDELWIRSLEYLRDTFSKKEVSLAIHVASQFPMTGMGSFIDPRPLIPQDGEDEEYCNLIFLTLAHAWIALLTKSLFDGQHPNKPQPQD